MDAARRGFLRGGFLTSEGRKDIERQAIPAGVPPPWFAGHVDTVQCADCEHPCVAACDVGMIRIHPEGHGYAGVPYLDFSASGCTFCGECADACPLEAVKVTANPPVLGVARLDTGQCFAWQSIVCVSCRFACQTRAIAADARSQPSVDSGLCNGCGACVPVCPQKAITITSLP